MNTPAHDEDELRCAEYALGVLDAAERAALEADVARNPALQRTLDDWSRRLAPLSLDVRPVTPPGRVWTRIARDLGFLAPATASGPQSAPPAAGWWNSLSLWRWLGIGASVAALALLAVNLRQTPQPQAPAATTAANAYMVATIARKDGVAHWTATVDVRNSRMVVVPAVLASIDADKATELWLIVPNQKPIALGVFPARESATMQLPPDIMAKLDAQAVLAVSLEPTGGSPTGQPTGPVLATGAMHAT
jgi:anti-sigma-K factor RskA